jgi:hypothetical protein
MILYVVLGGGGLGPDFNNYVVGREGHTSIIILYVGWRGGSFQESFCMWGGGVGGGPIFNHYFALFQWGYTFHETDLWNEISPLKGVLNYVIDNQMLLENCDTWCGRVGPLGWAIIDSDIRSPHNWPATQWARTLNPRPSQAGGRHSDHGAKELHLPLCCWYVQSMFFPTPPHPPKLSLAFRTFILNWIDFLQTTHKFPN